MMRLTKAAQAGRWLLHGWSQPLRAENPSAEPLRHSGLGVAAFLLCLGSSLIGAYVLLTATAVSARMDDIDGLMFILFWALVFTSALIPPLWPLLLLILFLALLALSLVAGGLLVGGILAVMDLRRPGRARLLPTLALGLIAAMLVLQVAVVG